MIEVRELTKKYGSNTVVDALSFTIGEGKVYGFLGPNGAGKSTTMNMITGCLAPTAGSVTVDGFDNVRQPRETKRRIGYLPELPPVYPEMTVREYLELVCELRGVRGAEKERELRTYMERTHIAHMRDRLIRNLSKGYRQRVGLAQAAIGSPRYIILDEPTVGLDPQQIIETREFIRSLRGEHSVILSSHILSEISAVCDEIIIISHGKLVACDSMEKLGSRVAKQFALQLTVKGGEEAVRTALAPLAAETEIALAPSDEEGSVNVTVRHDGTADWREAAFRALAAADCPILRMVSETMNLEDVFLELTHSGAAADGTEGKK